MIYSQSDVLDISYCGWMEDRSDGISGCFLVMQVVYNRCFAQYFPHTIHGVVYQPGAFSWTLPSDPEHGKQPAADDPIYLACLADAPNILSGTNADLTKGSLYYANETEVGEGWYRKNIINKSDLHPVTLVYGKLTYRK